MLVSRESIVLPDGTSLMMRHWGARDPVFVLIHGLGDNASVWATFATAVAHCGSCVAIDSRGHGDSQWDRAGRYTVALHASDVDFVLERLGLHSILLIGHSLGAQIAIHVAAAAPQRVRGVVLVEGGPEMSRTALDAIRTAFIEQPRRYPSVPDYADYLRRKLPLGQPVLLREVAASFLRMHAGGELELKCDPAVVNALLETSDDVLWRLLERMSRDVLLVRGAWSGVLGRAAAERISQRINGCQIHTVPNAGHAVMLENPDNLSSAVSQFALKCGIGAAP